MKKLTNEQILKFKDHFNEVYEGLDDIINRIVYLRSVFGKYPFDLEYTTWEYDGLNFEIEATEKSCGCCDADMHYYTITWDDIMNVDSLEEKLKQEAEERKKLEEEKKKLKEEAEKKRNEDAERRRYEELKVKYEKS